MATRAKSRSVGAFLMLSLDGYFCDPKGDMNFLHKSPEDTEWYEFMAGNSSGESVLLFGRTTYDMMVDWWPTPMAAQAMPEVAAQMNALPKVVFSRAMPAARWNNTRVEKDLVGGVRRMKQERGPDMTVLGSGSIVTQLAAAGLLDVLQVVVNPMAIGAGKSIFAGLGKRVDLKLAKTRSFKNGSVALWYEPR